MLQRVQTIMSKLFGTPAETITEESSPKTIAKWDSITHMNLILSLEDEFGVQFSDEEIPSMTTVARILECLRNRPPRGA
jgi:acyl carrier protein